MIRQKSSGRPAEDVRQRLNSLHLGSELSLDNGLVDRRERAEAGWPELGGRVDHAIQLAEVSLRVGDGPSHRGRIGHVGCQMHDLSAERFQRQHGADSSALRFFGTFLDPFAPGKTLWYGGAHQRQACLPAPSQTFRRASTRCSQVRL